MTAIKRFKELEGLYIVEDIMKKLGVKRQTALNILSRYKKEGYVTVSGGRGNKRIYKITKNKQRDFGTGLFDILNKYSKIKILAPYEYKHIGKIYKTEEAIIDSLKIKSPRIMIALISVFPHVKDWHLLYALAKKNNFINYLGAMYETARLIKKKMPKMDGKTYNALLKNCRLKEEKVETIKGIEKRWNVGLGFNEKDLIQ